MNIQKILESTKNDLLTEIDNRIYLKTYKDGNKQKTQISGLEDFISDKDIKAFAKEIKKHLGCSGTIMKDEKENTNVIFSGDHVQFIKKHLIDKEIDEKYIKC